MRWVTKAPGLAGFGQITKLLLTFELKTLLTGGIKVTKD